MNYGGKKTKMNYSKKYCQYEKKKMCLKVIIQKDKIIKIILNIFKRDLLQNIIVKSNHKKKN